MGHDLKKIKYDMNVKKGNPQELRAKLLFFLGMSDNIGKFVFCNIRKNCYWFKPDNTMLGISQIMCGLEIVLGGKNGCIS